MTLLQLKSLCAQDHPSYSDIPFPLRIYVLFHFSKAANLKLTTFFNFPILLLLLLIQWIHWDTSFRCELYQITSLHLQIYPCPPSSFPLSHSRASPSKFFTYVLSCLPSPFWDLAISLIPSISSFPLSPLYPSPIYLFLTTVFSNIPASFSNNCHVAYCSSFDEQMCGIISWYTWLCFTFVYPSIPCTRVLTSMEVLKWFWGSNQWSFHLHSHSRQFSPHSIPLNAFNEILLTWTFQSPPLPSWLFFPCLLGAQGLVGEIW